jgi:hypothetical protein
MPKHVLVSKKSASMINCAPVIHTVFKHRMRSVNFLRSRDVTLDNDSPRRYRLAENLSFVGWPGFVQRSPNFLLITRSQNFSLYKQTN